MLKAQGYARMDYDDGTTKEADSFTCAHCQKVTFVGAGQNAFDLGGFCRLCSKLICSKCADKGSCTPWEKEMERREDQARFRASIGV